MSDNFRTFLIALAALFAGGFGATVIVDDGEKTRTVRIEVGKPKLPEGVTLDKGTELSVAEQKKDAAKPFSVAPVAPSLANAGPDIHEDLKDETPPGITRDEADDALVTPPGIGQPQPPAGAQNYRCDKRTVRNYSQRANGVKVSMFVLHFTVSQPGSLNAIYNLFNNPNSGASSTYGLELDGECEQWVPFAKKAWTQGAFNSASESVEIVTNDLSREQWLAEPILKRGILANIVADRLRARGLPPKLVDPVGCTPKAGYTDHSRLECGNTHWDTGARFPWDVLGKQIRARFNPGLTKRQKWERRHAALHKPNGPLAQCKLPGRGETPDCKQIRSKNRAYHKLLERNP